MCNALNLPLTELFGEADKGGSKGPDLFSSLKHGATLISPPKAVRKEESKDAAGHLDGDKSTPLQVAGPGEGEEKGGEKYADGEDAGEREEGGSVGGGGEGGGEDGDQGGGRARGEQKGDIPGDSKLLPAPERRGSQLEVPASVEGSHPGRRSRRKSIMSDDVSPDEEIDRCCHRLKYPCIVGCAEGICSRTPPSPLEQSFSQPLTICSARPSTAQTIS